MEAKSCDIAAIYSMYSQTKQDLPVVVLDLRPYKDFRAQHLCLSFCVRLSNNKEFLADYSKSSYDMVWKQGLWWGKDVFIYGEEGLKKDHPVIDFLAKENQCRSLRYYRHGFESLESSLPFLCTASVKAGSARRLPSALSYGELYLGDWDHATDSRVLSDLHIGAVVTAHNNAETLKLAGTCSVSGGPIQHMRIEIPDIEAADMARHFLPVYEFIEQAIAKKIPVLIHCGAGVSRSGCLAASYLMRHHRWSAARARDFLLERRRIVSMNRGFWRQLIQLEDSFGLPDSERTPEGERDIVDAAEVAATSAAALAVQRIAVKMLSPAEIQAEEGEEDVPRSPDPKSSECCKDAEESRSGSLGKRTRDSSEDGRGEGRDTTESNLVVKKPKRGAGGGTADPITLIFDVSKVADGSSSSAASSAAAPAALVGRLVAGPIRFPQKILLGRLPSADVVLEHASLSRRHAEIGVDVDGAPFVMDLGSAHGTRMGEIWLRPSVTRKMQVGDVLQFGASTRRYKLIEIRLS